MKLFTNGEIPSNASTKIQLKLTERPLDINLMVSAAIWVREWHVRAALPLNNDGKLSVIVMIYM